MYFWKIFLVQVLLLLMVLWGLVEVGKLHEGDACACADSFFYCLPNLAAELPLAGRPKQGCRFRDG